MLSCNHKAHEPFCLWILFCHHKHPFPQTRLLLPLVQAALPCPAWGHMQGLPGKKCSHKCLYFPYYMAGYFPGSPRISCFQHLLNSLFLTFLLLRLGWTLCPSLFLSSFVSSDISSCLSICLCSCQCFSPSAPHKCSLISCCSFYLIQTRPDYSSS